MHFGRLGRGELVAAVGGLLLAVCLFLPVVRDGPGQPERRDRRRSAARSAAGRCTPLMRWLLLAAALGAVDPRSGS